MARPILCCTDGSDAANDAVTVGLALIADADDIVLVTVLPPSDPMLVTGTGFAGGSMSAEEFNELEASQVSEGEQTVAEAAAAVGATRTQVLRGDAGRAICDYADEIDARVIVMGSRGRGGLKRAVLGSVSDHVVRNAPCPVVITPPTD
ncbi:MAG: universal stress protein [Acidimicrobiales bacterium]|nr:universal stress protein [Acidimicrobiales bacterium]